MGLFCAYKMLLLNTIWRKKKTNNKQKTENSFPKNLHKQNIFSSITIPYATSFHPTKIFILYSGEEMNKHRVYLLTPSDMHAGSSKNDCLM